MDFFDELFHTDQLGNVWFCPCAILFCFPGNLRCCYIPFYFPGNLRLCQISAVQLSKPDGEPKNVRWLLLEIKLNWLNIGHRESILAFFSRVCK